MRYEIHLSTDVSDTVLAAFPEFTVLPDGARQGTTLRGDVVDLAHLHGVLARVQNLALDLTDLRRLTET